ncbi:uncharacterized protein LOC111676439 [Lucilia cuprina]|uniref:uncharacterized protein LOC111676439 n=1 Tax=Lucilia cuprina TaxID=7375 RepID=UPI001F05D99C|nr:uncharacterized protein LOC111676439 [Lucilia cuprina]
MPASERYRTHDGTCNNKKRLRWGAAQMPFNRFLPPEYGDGVDTTRKAVDGGPLSSSRFVSLLVHGARDGEAPLTLMLAQWGQLVDHDLTSTAQPRSINGSVPSCCGSKDFHPSCFPIKVPLDDPWLSPLKVRCLEFLRSAPAQRRDCVLSWREQTNQATSYIDASPIYSSSVRSSDNARVFRKGLLIFGRGNPADDVCQRGAIATHCIRSGDGRSGEQPGLLALHHVWVHEHNHIATKLSEMNLHWSDEKIYQETRRIIGAMFQHITYREFLPIVLGREVVKVFDLELLNSGYYEGYDYKTNPTVANAFAAAAFRFGHSLVQNSYMRCDRFHNVINNNVSLHEEFQRGDIGSVGSLHRLLRGMATQRALKRDEFITPELTNHLFQTPGFPFGLDLAAINIQRGRDHGIPPYTHWRVPCGLTPINNWDEFANVVGPESARRISHAYHSVHDIDLFVGGIAERPVVGGLVGPTFACIIAQQFSNSRKGDRFWYENGGFESSFTPAQLHSIRRVSLASVLCRAVGGGTFQPHIFLPAEFPDNVRLPCGVPPLGDFDISPWLEQDPFASLQIANTQVQQSVPASFRPQTTFKPQPPPPTFKPQTLPDRVFDIMQLETKSPDNNDTPISDNKVGFSNRNPVKDSTISLLKQPTPFVPNVSNGFLTVKNSSKVSDKLDLKRKGTAGHITKQKPVPAVNNKLDKNHRKGGNRHGGIQNTTRRTIIVNNIPIELRSAGKDTAKTETKKTESEPEARTGNAKLSTTTNKTKDNVTKTEVESFKMEPRIADVDATLTEQKKNQKPTDNLEVQNMNSKDKDIKTSTNEETGSNNSNINDQQQNKTDKSKTDKDQHEQIVSLNPIETPASVTDKQSQVIEKIITITKTLQNSELKNLTLTGDLVHDANDSDIDPMVQAIPIEHKRVQRKLIPSSLTDKIKDKLKLTPTNLGVTNRNITTLNTGNRTLTTKPPKPSRTTVRPLELRQYQNRPAYTKTPQKVIVDSVNGDNQYEIEINIRQTNKSPKPLQNTPYTGDYTNIYKPSQFDRYQTTPIYAYYQPAPTQISTIAQNQRTKPPTIIFVNEHEERMTTKQPGFLQSIVGWSLATKRPLPTSIGFNERPLFENIISSPHSTAIVQKPPNQLTLPAVSSSFSQAQVGTGSIVQASSASVSNGNFGTIAGFTNANGADSTFSFNIRPKPDRTQNVRPTGNGGNYGLTVPPQYPWYAQNPDYTNLPLAAGEQIVTHELPNRENINSPFSTSNSQTYYIRKKNGPRHKEALTLTQTHELADYDYAGRTLEHLHNITTNKDSIDAEEDYEYDEDYGTSPLLRKFNQDGYLRPEHMIGTILKVDNDKTIVDLTNLTHTILKDQTLDDNYVLPVLNNTHDLPKDLPKPLNTNFSTDFPDALAKQLNNDILAEDNEEDHKDNTKDTGTKPQDKANVLSVGIHKRNRNRNKTKNNKRNQAKIAFAPINILTKPERPDNWVFFDSPKDEEPMLPKIPEINMDPVPSAELPKPFKENIWLDLAKIKQKVALQFQGPIGHLLTQKDDNLELQTDQTNAKDKPISETTNTNADSLKDSILGAILTDGKNNVTEATKTDLNIQNFKNKTETKSTDLLENANN